MKKLLSLLCAFLVVGSLSGCNNNEPEPVEQPKMVAGTYENTVKGMHGPIKLSVTVDEDRIVDAQIVENMESPGVGDRAAKRIASEIVEYQSLDIDTVAGATITSKIVLNAFEKCLEDAQADIELLKADRPRDYGIKEEYSSDVVIVGGGGAGLTAAVSALEAGATVTIIEKTDLFGGNSILAGGFMNARVPEIQDYLFEERKPSIETLVTDAINEEPVSEAHAELQQLVKEEYEEYLKTDKTLFDSENFHALQTWNGGDKIADLEVVKVFAHNADDVQRWLIENGLNFRDEMWMGGGALYSRSRYPDAKYPSGTGYFVLFEKMLSEYGDDKLNILYSTKADDLIVDENGKVVGVNATHQRTGQTIKVTANNGVILATGGFAGNVDLRVKYAQGEKWPDLGPSLNTTNTGSVTGDGIFMAEEAGAALVNMDQIQLLPYCDPDTGVGTNTTDLKGHDYVFINKEGKRFVREDGRRDDMSKAIMSQTDGRAYMLINTTMAFEDMKTQSGQSVKYLVENGVSGYVYGKNLEELAKEMNVPYDTLRKTLEDFAAAAEGKQEDEFGRKIFATSIDVDGEFVAYFRAPAVHHTMGGVKINTEAQVINTEGNAIDGLYAAGEITGVVHGGNRLGGNAISDFLVFGRIAGINAANHK